MPDKKKTAPKKTAAAKPAPEKKVAKKTPTTVAKKPVKSETVKATSSQKTENILAAVERVEKIDLSTANASIGSEYSIQGRHFFTDDRSILTLPPLIQVQVDSYLDFLIGQATKDINDGARSLNLPYVSPADPKKDTSLIGKAFRDVFPIVDFSGEKVEIHYKSYSIDEPKYSISDCKRKNLNYEAPLKVKLEMLDKKVGEIKEQEVYFGGVPLMTPQGTFIVNGVERVVIHQIIRSTGMFFTRDNRSNAVTMKVIPQRGSWIEIEAEKRGALNVKIDKKRKIPFSVLLRAYGLESDAEIISTFKDLGKEAIEKYIAPTVEKDKTKNRMEALHALYKLLRPGDLGTEERVQDLFETTFFDVKKFDLGEVARMKIGRKLGSKVEYEGNGRFLSLEDLIDGTRYLIKLMFEKPGFESDDIDHLENRRIRSVGELVSDKIRTGLTRMEKIAKDRMTVVEMTDATAGTFINSRPVIASLREFFGTSQLSQFMDQSNPLSELAHKRRLTALGTGGLTRERASFEVRDVHPTQYGRICPIATPEGPNIGLVLYFANFARVDKYGFILTPFRKIEHYALNDGKDTIGRITLDDIVDSKDKVIIPEKTVITEEMAKKLQSTLPEMKKIEVRGFLTTDYEYIDAYEERALTIAEANTAVDEKGNFLETRVSARQHNEASVHYIRQVTHMDVSPKQIMSESTSLIPFLEHDIATRAEMGTNMMRQAVPLVKPQSPIVGTGMERAVGEDSGYVIRADEDGEIIGVDAKHVSVLYRSGRKATYGLRTFERSNGDMIIYQKPIVVTGQKIKTGDVLTDGQSIENGELALGQNLLVAYMPWNGYNYEDAIVISSRLVSEDVFTSVHISEYILDVRETKLGPEQTTNDIPNVSSNKLKDLDEDGLVRIGASVNAGDILVGKVTPKGEVELSPEERLLRAIFGDKSKDVKDSSLKIPSGSGGKVIAVHTLRREDGDNLPTGVFKQIKVYVAQTRKIEVGDKMAGRHGNKGIVSRIVPAEDMPFTEDGRPVDIVLNPLGVLSRMNIGQILEAHLGLAAKNLGIKVATPILNGLHTEQIGDLMVKAGLPRDGKMQLFDGKTGDAFKERTMVGMTYMLKLHHLVEDKIHARSVGPYSMVTQQPLGGKAQNGGQRLGEMEVWALQGYGAANILQEMLTIKSDDIDGRTQAYEAIVKGKAIKRPNMPESFNVLLRELQALNLNVELLDEAEKTTLESEQRERYRDLPNISGQFDLEIEEASEELVSNEPVVSGAEDPEA